MTLSRLQPAGCPRINFVPVRGDFARGIFAVTTLQCRLTQEQAVRLFKDFYRDAPFTVVSDFPIDLKQAVNTNKALIHIDSHDGMLLVTAAIDNLLKGASDRP